MKRWWISPCSPITTQLLICYVIDKGTKSYR